MTTNHPNPSDGIIRAARQLRLMLGTEAESTARRWAEQRGGDRRWLAVAELLHDHTPAWEVAREN